MCNMCKDLCVVPEVSIDCRCGALICVFVRVCVCVRVCACLYACACVGGVFVRELENKKRAKESQSENE